jgi:outer membrane protein TolC
MLSAAALSLACGCASVRAAREAQRGEKPVPGERTPSAASLGIGTNTILTVDAAVRLALAQQPAIAAASQNLAAASAQVRQAGAGRRPSVQGSAGYVRSTSNTDPAAASSRSSGGFSGAVQADLTLIDFGRVSAAERQALASEAAAAAALRGARNDAAFSTRTSFFNLCKAQELLAVAEEAVRQYREHLEQVKAYEEVGKRTRYDVTKSEVDLGNAELDLIAARNAVSDARAALNRQLGLAEEPGFGVVAAPALEFAGTPDDAARMARLRHPDIHALLARELAASSTVDAAIAELYPSVSLGARYTVAGSSMPLVWNWTAGLNSVVSLFSGWRKVAGIEKATADLRASRANRAGREQQLHAELTSAMNQLEAARRRVSLSALVARQAREGLDIVNEKYRLGSASSLELTDAQVAHTGARAEQVRARYDCQTAIARILHATGEDP